MPARKVTPPKPRRRSRPEATAAGAARLDMSPARYIARVDRASGREIEGPIDPHELLVHAHRDNHPLEIATQFAASRFIQVTGNEAFVRDGLRFLGKLGGYAAGSVGWLTGSPEAERRTRRVLGVSARGFVFQFREPTHRSERDVKARIAELQKEARQGLAARGRNPRLRVLLTGATGFVGKEIMAQAAADRRIEEVVAVIRPETIRDRKTKAVLKVLSPEERGALLMQRLHIPAVAARKFRFVDGDIEKPGFGLAAAELPRLRTTITHVIHCAASVSFDDPYESSFRSNVLGCRNALALSLGIQRARGSKFVSHVAIETSYIHGRRKRSIAQESALNFPAHFYNNFYELTKAMASIETDRAMVDEGLRVTQLLPSIVIGHSRSGNNRGDTKVVNAPINAFGRAKEALDSLEGSDLATRVKTFLVGRLATSFPADRSAELNLVPVDRVAAGILAALLAPEAIGARIHLATDNRIRSEDVVRIVHEELGVNVRLADPTLTRNLTLPIVKAALNQLGETRLAEVLEKLGTIFGVYGEWGQPIHDVGNDVRILGLPIRRPDTAQTFRMLCRHNRYVQEYGKVRDQDEIARRERIWDGAIEAIEFETGRQVASLSPRSFLRFFSERLDLRTFTPYPGRGEPKRSRKEHP
jgi:nucleoside-diphosphate-sugar epimerase